MIKQFNVESLSGNTTMIVDCSAGSLSMRMFLALLIGMEIHEEKCVLRLVYIGALANKQVKYRNIGTIILVLESTFHSIPCTKKVQQRASQRIVITSFSNGSIGCELRSLPYFIKIIIHLFQKLINTSLKVLHHIREDNIRL